MPRASIISKLFVVPRLQPRRHRARTEARSHSHAETWFHGELQWPRPKEVATINIRRRRCTKEAAKAECVCSDDEKLGPIRSNNYIWWQRERNRVMYHQRRSYQDRRRKVRTTGFLALQFIVKCLKAPTPRVSPWRGCILTLTQTIGLRSLQMSAIRMPGKAGTMMMEVKVDPGAQPSCIPLHKFKTLFPHLCRDGLPKEGLLDNTQNEFQSYNGGDMTCYGHILIDVKDKVTKKYHPIRFYVMNTDVPRILISHAASYWLGLVRVLCDNKAPRIKRQVASIDKKSNFRAKSGHFRTSSPNTASSSQKKQTTPKTVTSGKGDIPSPRMHSFEDAKLQGRKTEPLE